MVVAHHGAIEHYEILLGFLTQRTRIDRVELDIRRSKDGVLVVHHDAHLADGRLIRDIDSKIFLLYPQSRRSF